MLDHEECRRQEEVYGGWISLDSSLTGSPTDEQILKGFKMKDADTASVSQWVYDDGLYPKHRRQLVEGARKEEERIWPHISDKTPRYVFSSMAVVVYGDLPDDQRVPDGKIDSESLDICVMSEYGIRN